MHKDIQNIRKRKQISSPWHLLSLRGRCFITSCNAISIFAQEQTQQKCTNVKEDKIKFNTSNMRSHNKVIQVRCVEIKLKVNNSNNNNSKHQQQRRQQQQGDERDAAQGRNNTERKRGLIYSVVLLVAPLSCWAVSHPISDFFFNPPHYSSFLSAILFSSKKNKPKRRQ